MYGGRSIFLPYNTQWFASVKHFGGIIAILSVFHYASAEMQFCTQMNPKMPDIGSPQEKKKKKVRAFQNGASLLSKRFRLQNPGNCFLDFSVLLLIKYRLKFPKGFGFLGYSVTPSSLFPKIPASESLVITRS